MMPGKFPIIVEILAAIAKKPSTSDDVKNVANDKSHTPNKSKCCFMFNLNMLCVVHVVVFRNRQSHIHQALKPLLDAPPKVYPN